MTQIYFYAADDDMANVLKVVEERVSVAYVRCGSYPDKNFELLRKWSEIPRLGLASGPSRTHCDSYSVIDPAESVYMRPITLYTGAQTYTIDPGPVVLCPGGRWEEGSDVAIISGTVGAMFESGRAQLIMKAFRSAIRKQFVKIRALNVGPCAERALRSGMRLTDAVQSPPEYNLALPDPDEAPKRKPSATRLSVPETWLVLEQAGYSPPRDASGNAIVAPRMPRYDDAPELGLSFFRTQVEDEDFRQLSLPRIFLGRSSIERVRFQGTELKESRMCWNDFDHCDFSECDLTGSDLRASQFVSCNFTKAILREADLRHATFLRCKFGEADLTGAVLDRGNSAVRRLTDAQCRSVAWREDPGIEPDGG